MTVADLAAAAFAVLLASSVALIGLGLATRRSRPLTHPEDHLALEWVRRHSEDMRAYRLYARECQDAGVTPEPFAMRYPLTATNVQLRAADLPVPRCAPWKRPGYKPMDQKS